VHIPVEWETVSTSEHYKVLARGRIDKTREFWGITDPIESCQMIQGTYYFYFKNGLVFKCPAENRGVSEKTIEAFDAMKEDDGSLHLCDPELVLLEKGDIKPV